MKRTYIIAEMAYSHDGSQDLAKTIVHAAADAGADAVSIHLTHMPSYMVRHYKTEPGRVSEGELTKSIYEYIDDITIPFDQWEGVVSDIREKNLDLLIMPNDQASLEFSETLKPDAYVLSAACFEEYDFIAQVGKKGLPVYLRVGGATIGEIESVVNILFEQDNTDITLLYGHQNYPTTIEDTNIFFLSYLKKVFGLPVGMADHVDADDDFALDAPLLALPLGISCIEKHITHDRSKKGEDFESALNKDEFKLLVEKVRKAELALTDKGLLEFTKSNVFYRQNVRKRVVAATDIKSGETITKEKLACKRSDEGVFPSQMDGVIGLTALDNIKKDQGIDLSLFRQEKNN